MENGVVGVSRRQFTGEFKPAEVARGMEVHPSVLDRWRREFRQSPGKAFAGNGRPRRSEGRIAELERKIGRQVLEIDFLQGCLQRIEERRMLQASTGNPQSAGRSPKRRAPTVD